jgi:hypothetical protein
MSALPPKADISRREWNVGLDPIGDMPISWPSNGGSTLVAVSAVGHDFIRPRIANYLPLRFDEDYQGLWHYAIKDHCISSFFALQCCFQCIHVRHIHQYTHVIGILWINEGSYIGHPEWPENLFALRGGEPVLRTFCNVMMGHNCWHSILPARLVKITAD